MAPTKRAKTSSTGARVLSEDAIEKPLNDKRLYRLVELGNGMRCLLISDPQIAAEMESKAKQATGEEGDEDGREESEAGEEEGEEEGVQDEGGALEAGSKISKHELRHQAMLDALWQAMGMLQPAPSIIFVGKMGVARVEEALSSHGLSAVQTLHGLTDTTSGPQNAAPFPTTDLPASNLPITADAVGQQDRAPRAAPPAPADAPGSGDRVAAEWATTPVYVASERWGRGLDLDVDYVFILGPPASSATYTHLAGRTARKGQRGLAVSVLTPAQAPRLVAFSGALRLNFTSLGAWCERTSALM